MATSHNLQDASDPAWAGATTDALHSAHYRGLGFHLRTIIGPRLVGCASLSGRGGPMRLQPRRHRVQKDLELTNRLDHETASLRAKKADKHICLAPGHV